MQADVCTFMGTQASLRCCCRSPTSPRSSCFSRPSALRPWGSPS